MASIGERSCVVWRNLLRSVLGHAAGISGAAVQPLQTGSRAGRRCGGGVGVDEFVWVILAVVELLLTVTCVVLDVGVASGDRGAIGRDRVGVWHLVQDGRAPG